MHRILQNNKMVVEPLDLGEVTYAVTDNQSNYRSTFGHGVHMYLFSKRMCMIHA